VSADFAGELPDNFEFGGCSKYNQTIQCCVH
jgi:hypothetical protein